MASSVLRRSLLRRASLRHAFPPHPPPAAAGASRRSFQSGDGYESLPEFEQRLFANTGKDEGSLYAKLDRAENASRRYRTGSGMDGLAGFGNTSSSGPSRGGFPGFSDSSSSRSAMGSFDWLGDRSNSGSMGGSDSLNDGFGMMLGDAAYNADFEEGEEGEDGYWEDDDFEFRSDVPFKRGSTYSVRDLDLRRPAAAKNPPRPQFETTTAEVLRKADFRNVRFLSNFLTEAGIIIKRSQTRISAKAQRKIAREIKTARAFGLMPFTTMGRRPFIFGRSAEEHYSEEEHFDFVRQKDREPVEDDGDAEPNVEVA